MHTTKQFEFIKLIGDLGEESRFKNSITALKTCICEYSGIDNNYLERLVTDYYNIGFVKSDEVSITLTQYGKKFYDNKKKNGWAE